MTMSASAIARHAARAILPVALLAAACRSPAPSVPVAAVDFIKEFERADARPPGAYAAGEHVSAGTALPAIAGPAPGRLTWTLPLPRGGTFRAHVMASGARVRVRVGVSDARIYEQLAERIVAPDAGWSPMSADLSAYAGFKISLFYRPDAMQWRVNLSADAIEGPATVFWGRPEVVASTGDAREYVERRARLSR
jgi:hypothetical protein